MQFLSYLLTKYNLDISYLREQSYDNFQFFWTFKRISFIGFCILRRYSVDKIIINYILYELNFCNLYLRSRVIFSNTLIIIMSFEGSVVTILISLFFKRESPIFLKTCQADEFFEIIYVYKSKS